MKHRRGKRVFARRCGIDVDRTCRLRVNLIQTLSEICGGASSKGSGDVQAGNYSKPMAPRLIAVIDRIDTERKCLWWKFQIPSLAWAGHDEVPVSMHYRADCGTRRSLVTSYPIALMRSTAPW